MKPEQLMTQAVAVIRLTGRPGAGKSTLPPASTRQHGLLDQVEPSR
jgi:adenylylsulfate kinase-like enzyme